MLKYIGLSGRSGCGALPETSILGLLHGDKSQLRPLNFYFIDNPGNFDAIGIRKEGQFEVHKEEGLLGGANVLHYEGFRAIPYYAWPNREWAR